MRAAASGAASSCGAISTTRRSTSRRRASRPARAMSSRPRARRDAEHDARERPLAPALGARAQHLAHGELAQRREVLGAEEVGERRVDAFARINLAFAQPLAQHVGRHVHEQHLVRELEHGVGQRLAHARPRQAFDRVADPFEMCTLSVVMTSIPLRSTAITSS